ncbi:hypothetical protein EVAR_51349_1 [Eumeta japonica]|uniref:Uncharacterized protein n=1 Tax=Eumeta variegata TaxID=151549 RepID=A0A4C1Y138_EUMVA|nr:hypothetical protein EVAR_51349_1 [Eumeta japonica]
MLREGEGPLSRRVAARARGEQRARRAPLAFRKECVLVSRCEVAGGGWRTAGGGRGSIWRVCGAHRAPHTAHRDAGVTHRWLLRCRRGLAP